MVTLEFKDELTNNRFSGHNEFMYQDLRSLGILYGKHEKELPFIMRGTVTNSRRWNAVSRKTVQDRKEVHIGREIYYSAAPRQLRGRVLVTNKIKEVLDSSPVPLIFKLGSNHYLIGKGFLALYHLDGSIDPLFFATAPTNVPSDQLLMQDIKYYISRDVWRPIHKRFHQVLKDFMHIHPGDVLISNDISKYLGRKIEIPAFKSIKEKKDFNDKVLDYCLHLMRKEVPQIKGALSADQKKMKEETILACLREEKDVDGTTLAAESLAEEARRIQEAITAANTVITAIDTEFDEADDDPDSLEAAIREENDDELSF